MELTHEELQLMVQHLTQEVAKLTLDKALLMSKIELLNNKEKQGE